MYSQSVENSTDLNNQIPQPSVEENIEPINPDMPDKKVNIFKMNKKMLLYIILIVLTVGLVPTALFVSWKSTHRQENNTVQTTPSSKSVQVGNVIPTPIPIEMPELDYEMIKEKLEDILNNDVKYSQVDDGYMSSDVYQYTYEGDLIYIIAYKYTEGQSILNEYYEGSEWQINLDDEVEQFKKLEEGTQEAMSCAGFGGCEFTTVSLNNFGGTEWAYIEYNFRPSLSWNRVYYTYDEPSQQLIYISLSYLIPSTISNQELLENYPEITEQLHMFETEVLSR